MLGSGWRGPRRLWPRRLFLDPGSWILLGKEASHLTEAPPETRGAESCVTLGPTQTG